MKKTAAFLLALLMLAASMTACGESDDSNAPAVTTASQAVTEAPETESDVMPLGLDPELNYGGYEVKILTPSADEKDSFVTEQNGDLVADALYSRDRTVEELLSVKLTPVSYSDLGMDTAKIEKMVAAGEDVYDFMHLQGSTFFANKPTFEINFLDVSDSENLSIDSPWWNGEAMRNLSYNGESIKYLIGDISTSSFSGASVIFYNKQLFDNLYQNPDLPYTDVIDGTWTIDKFAQYCTEGYSDINGDSQGDRDDTWGTMANIWLCQSFYNGFGEVKFHERDENGYVRLNIDTNRAVLLGEKLYSLIWENSGIMYVDDTKWHETAMSKFANNEMLFITNFLFRTQESEMRNMEADYGILPMFKLDEEQENYVSDLNPSGTKWIVIPTTNKDPERTTAVIEALSYYSYYNVTPTFYEDALKAKYVRDSQSGQVIDIVRDSICTDYLIGIYRSTIGQHIINRVIAKKNDFVSSWEKSLSSYTKQMEKAYETLDRHS